ncbi:MAG TPA: carotenoid oxygenase family protein [Allosphingosinicella sp.]|nr:carotenoid oxygenase family protein [Allosphingosinicella sp.]
MTSIETLTIDRPTAAQAEAKQPNPFLTGAHAPLTEEFTIEDLPVIGAIPAALDGRYLRIGPNPMAADPDNYHWFTGDGMIHGLRLEGGKALWYRNRWVRSDAVTTALGEPRTEGPRHLFDTVNTNVLGFAGRTLGLVEAGSTPIEIGETLETLRYTDFEGTLHGSFTAHPHVDPLTGEMHGICYDAMNPVAIRYVVVTPEGRVRREVAVPVEHGPMIHDCAITRRFAILLDLPVTFSMETAMAGHPFPYRWNPSHAARIGLLPREGAAEDVIWIETDPCYVFHAVNAYDAEDGQVILDVAVHDRMFSDGKAGPDSRRTGLERWTIDPVGRIVRRRVIDTTPQEFPRPDERRFGLPYRYAYTMQMGAAFLGQGLLKHDLETGARQAHDFGPGRHPGEFVFVPAHADAGEDEGWLIGIVIDLNEETSELVILDARDFEGEAVARVKIPHRIPPGFHGNWVPRG